MIIRPPIVFEIALTEDELHSKFRSGSKSAYPQLIAKNVPSPVNVDSYRIYKEN
jgi:hypothetical protein